MPLIKPGCLSSLIENSFEEHSSIDYNSSQHLLLYSATFIKLFSFLVIKTHLALRLIRESQWGKSFFRRGEAQLKDADDIKVKVKQLIQLLDQNRGLIHI